MVNDLTPVEGDGNSGRRTEKPSIRSSSFDTGDLLGSHRLTSRDRKHLATISTRLRVRAGTTIFERGDPATAVYNIVSGAASSFRPLPNHGRRVMAFLFAEDLFGLARAGHYVNTVHALTLLTLFRIPLDALKPMLLRNPELQLHFLCKVTHALAGVAAARDRRRVRGPGGAGRALSRHDGAGAAAAGAGRHPPADDAPRYRRLSQPAVGRRRRDDSANWSDDG